MIEVIIPLAISAAITAAILIKFIIPKKKWNSEEIMLISYLAIYRDSKGVEWDRAIENIGSLIRRKPYEIVAKITEVKAFTEDSKVYVRDYELISFATKALLNVNTVEEAMEMNQHIIKSLTNSH